MKKTLLTLALIAVITQLAIAQWTTGSGLIYYSGGNVGIGTATPAQLFHIQGAVAGDVKALVENTTVNSIATASFESKNNSGYLTDFGSSSSAYNNAAVIGANSGFLFSNAPNGVGVALSNATSTFRVSTGGLTERFRIDASGNVGIGTTTPGAILSLGSTIQHQKLAVFESGNYQWGFGITNQQFEQYFASDNISNHFSWGSMSYDGNHTFTEMMRLDGSGNVAIGTADPKGYKLAVNGSAIATSMTVKLNANWPDYVFKPLYRLLPFEELKTYIDQNHHLPEMPTAAQIEKDGLNLGEMNKLLTKKVEELTLYLIEKDRQLKEEKEKNVAQQQQLDVIQKQVNELAKKLK